MTGKRCRRTFAAESLGVLTAAAFASQPNHASGSEPGKMRVAAVQMHALLGDVEANMRNAESKVKEATKQGAKVVVLPEFFTSGLGFHPAVMNASRPINGAPRRLLEDLARNGKASVGGSFLAESGGHVYNTFMLALPDGTVLTHDKDFPTGAVEQCLYAAGDDEEFVSILERNGQKPIRPPIPSRPKNNKDGVFRIDSTCVGTAMCWELARKRTDKRLRNGCVDLILGASGSYGLEAKSAVEAIGGTVDSLEKSFEQGRADVANAPKRLAKMTGAAVVHANLVGDNWAPRFPSGHKEVCRRFYGESRIVDHDVEEIAKLPGDAGEGVIVGDITPKRIDDVLPIGEGDWHIDMTPALRNFWYSSLGREYYLKVTRPHRELLRNR